MFSRSDSKKIGDRLALSLTAIGVLCAAWVIPVIQDEAYYWTWSNRLALRYFDHPPAIAFAIRAGTELFDHTLLGLRFFSVVSMFVVLFALRAAAARLEPRHGRKSALFILIGAPMFSLGFVPGTPDPLLGACIAVSAYLVVRAAEEPAEARWLFSSAFLLVASTLVKHYAALIALGALAGAALTPGGRARLKRPALWAGALLGMAALAPWLVSELAAGGGSIAFQASRVFQPADRWRGVSALPLMLGSMMGTLGPLTALCLIAFSMRALSRRDSTVATTLAGGGSGLLVACLIAVVLGSGEANWAIPALLFFVPIIAVELGRRPRLLKSTYAVSSLTAVVLVAYLVHAAHPYLPLPLSKDPIARGAGFESVADQASQLAERYGAKSLVSSRYQSSSLLRYYLRDRYSVLEMGSSSSRRSQYDLWARPRLCPGEPFVAVLEGPTLPTELHAELLEAPLVVEGRFGDRPGARRWVAAAVAGAALHDEAQPCHALTELTR